MILILLIRNSCPVPAYIPAFVIVPKLFIPCCFSKQDTSSICNTIIIEIGICNYFSYVFLSTFTLDIQTIHNQRLKASKFVSNGKMKCLILSVLK